jgi:hypothetical protein
VFITDDDTIQFSVVDFPISSVITLFVDTTIDVLTVFIAIVGNDVCYDYVHYYSVESTIFWDWDSTPSTA